MRSAGFEIGAASIICYCMSSVVGVGEGDYGDDVGEKWLGLGESNFRLRVRSIANRRQARPR